MEINLSEAKTKLSQLVERAMAVEEERIERPAGRVLGAAEGMVKYREGWDDPMTDAELEEFLGTRGVVLDETVA